MNSQKKVLYHKLNELQYELLEELPYFADLVPCYFFRNLEQFLRRKRFLLNEDTIPVVLKFIIWKA